MHSTRSPHFAVAIASLALAACGGSSPSIDTKDRAREMSPVGVDPVDGGDLCEVNGWYEDGECDSWCPGDDADCLPPCGEVGEGLHKCTLRPPPDPCEANHLYDNGMCDPECPEPDPDCEFDPCGLAEDGVRKCSGLPSPEIECQSRGGYVVYGDESGPRSCPDGTRSEFLQTPEDRDLTCCLPGREPGGCTADYTPVCGEDGKTYGNACTAEASGTSIAHDGSCTLAECEAVGGRAVYSDGANEPAQCEEEDTDHGLIVSGGPEAPFIEPVRCCVAPAVRKCCEPALEPGGDCFERSTEEECMTGLDCTWLESDPARCLPGGDEGYVCCGDGTWQPWPATCEDRAGDGQTCAE